MLPAKMADRIMLPDKVTEMENSIDYHTSINQSEESISIRCIIIQNNACLSNNIYRNIIGFKRHDSASAMFANNRIDTFETRF